MHVNALSIFLTEMKLLLNVMIIAIDIDGSVYSNLTQGEGGGYYLRDYCNVTVTATLFTSIPGTCESQPRLRREYVSSSILRAL